MSKNEDGQSSKVKKAMCVTTEAKTLLFHATVPVIVVGKTGLTTRLKPKFYSSASLHPKGLF